MTKPYQDPVDDTGCHFMHVDMDAFYASVELIKRPDLIGRPVIVGGRSGRGVVLSATYEARAAGVRSAMPVVKALKMIPHAVLLPPNHDQYHHVSRRVMELLGTITPEIEPLSIDEAFLDISGSIRRLGSPLHIAHSIREQVYTQEKITCSIGLANKKFVAKLATNACKPDGVLAISAERTVPYLHSLDVDQLWGVGGRTATRLSSLGITSVRDLAHTPRHVLVKAIGQAAAAHLHDLSWGVDDRKVETHRHEKSVGAEKTFDSDLFDEQQIRAELLRLSHKVARRARAQGVTGQSICVKLRTSDFSTITRSKTQTHPTDVARDIFNQSVALWKASPYRSRPLRLIGVRLENLLELHEHPIQPALSDPSMGNREIETAMDKIGARFGENAIGAAALLKHDNDPSAI